MTIEGADPGGGRTTFPAPPALVEHAERFRASGAAPATPRVAATVLLLRTGAAGFEVYVIRRVAAMAFGGMYAFPGGGVDPSDSQVPLDWVGPSPPQWGARLGLATEQAQAVVCAAAREVFEEAGVLLAGAHRGLIVGDVSGDDWEAARQNLVARRAGFAGLLHECGLALRSDLLLPWSRWITPEFEPRRFDTYFFIASLPEGQRTRNVSGEADHAMWIRPADALNRAKAGEIAMLPPTLMTLAEVAACTGWDGIRAAAAARKVSAPVTPRLETPPGAQPRFVLS